MKSPWALVLLDVAAVAAAIAFALTLRFDTLDVSEWLAPYLPVVLVPLLVRPIVFSALDLYRRQWRHASLQDTIDVVVSVALGSVVIVVVIMVARALELPGTSPFPRSFFVLEPLFVLTLVAGSRIAIRATLEHRAGGAHSREDELPTIVYGAGEAGAIIGRMAASGTLPGVRVVGYLDDDTRKRNSRLLGARVYGDLDGIAEVVQATGARQLLIAMPSGPGEPVRKAVAAAQELGLGFKTVAPFRNLLTGSVQITGIRPVQVEDLLRREPVRINRDAVGRSINGASVLVTGGGGSIGSELVRQILTLGPRALTIVENHEWTLWNVEREVAAFRREADGAHVIAALADVRSRAALDAVMSHAQPDIVFHAAALKHVPYVELFPSEGVLTNVVGTRNVLEASARAGVSRFILISTDKAVEPVSIMGATKRLAEQLTVMTGRRTGLAYAAARFGNVLGSSGSIIPLLQRQLDDGLPLTITEPEATRYFMTIGEAVSLILDGATDPRPGDVYVLDMGQPVRIIDLARDLVRLNGIDPDAVKFSITGLRPGERLHEKLFYDDERAERTSHEGIFRAERVTAEAGDEELEVLVSQLESAAARRDDPAVRSLLAHGRAFTGLSAVVGAETARNGAGDGAPRVQSPDPDQRPVR